MVEKYLEKSFQSYYTKSRCIVSYMLKMLSVEVNMNILEPCAGDGVFVDALLCQIPTLTIDTFESNPDAVEVLKSKYKGIYNVSVSYGDTLTNDELSLLANSGGFYDRIVANPPYGGWQDYDRRKMLKGIYEDISVKETYALFIYRSISLLRENGRLVFIVPDTWLHLRRHTQLRRYVFLNTKVIEIVVFPSSFFPDVNFGYANLCIVTLERSRVEDGSDEHQFEVLTGFKDPGELVTQTETSVLRQTFKQGALLKNRDAALSISDNEKVQNLINQAPCRIGDVAACVTGFYSGDDKNFLRRSPLMMRNSAKYGLVSDDEIYSQNCTEEIIDGVVGTDCFIPIVKGGNTKFIKPDYWYIKWSVEAVLFYKKSKKARFQNSRYYFKCGIGVPMVSSSRITAALLENRLFDQSIVGVFPHNSDLTCFFLAFFNTKVCNLLIRTINPSANNSANYIKQIPFIFPSALILRRVNELVEKIIGELKSSGSYDSNYEAELEEIFVNLYQI